jgi:hypothetical protein
VIVVLPRATQAQATSGTGSAADRAAVRAAVMDYVDGFYEGDSTKHVRSGAQDVYKYGYSKRGEAYAGMQMTWAGFMSFDRGVREGRNRPPANAPKDVVLFDVNDQTASAKLTAWWGIDYLLLAKRNGRWMVTHVMWQSPPPKR